MALNVFLSFVIAATLLIIAPGPTNMVIVSHSMRFGFRRSLITILGAALSHTIFFSITMLGITPLLLASATFFDWIKWVGAAYLIFLGIKQWREKPVLIDKDTPSATSQSMRSLFLQGFAVNSTNPKALVFFAVFFPPFLNPASPIVLQLLIMGITFIGIFILTGLLHAYLAGQVRVMFRTQRQIQLQNRVTGLLLTGAGTALATVRSK